jgi:hypothetical protein
MGEIFNLGIKYVGSKGFWKVKKDIIMTKCMNEKEVNETYPLICEKNHFVLNPLHERW